MASPQGTSGKTKKSASAAPQSIQKAPSTSSSASSPSTKSSLRQRKEQDLAYLQRPAASKTASHPPLPPLNSNFDRPNTRAHGASDARIDTKTSSRRRKKKTGTGSASPAIVVESVDQVIPESHPQGDGEDNTSVETIELTQSDGNTDVVASDPASSGATNQPQSTSSEPLTSLETSGKTTSTTPAVATEEAPTEPQGSLDGGQNMSPLDATSDGDRPISAPSTPVRIPAEVAIVNASPSKRVVFSPNKQESRLSTPTVLPVVNLRSILKSPTKQPPQANITGRTSSGGLSAGESTSRGFTGDVPVDVNSTEDGSNIAKAIESLRSDPVQTRTSTYTHLQAHFRTFSDTEQLDEVRATIRPFAAYLLRDMDPDNPPNL